MRKSRLLWGNNPIGIIEQKKEETHGHFLLFLSFYTFFTRKGEKTGFLFGEKFLFYIYLQMRCSSIGEQEQKRENLTRHHNLNKIIMERFYNKSWVLIPLLLFVCFSCTDKSYDLSDIDTTARFQTKSLVVPINLDCITLSQVLDLDDDSEIKKEIDADGRTFYAIKKEGTFESDPINISSFTINDIKIQPTTSKLALEIPPSQGYNNGIQARYIIATEEKPIITEFTATTNDFDKSIKDIEELGVETKFTIKISISKDEKGTKLSPTILKTGKVKFEGVKMRFPQGLTATASKGSFDSSTGILDLSQQQLEPDDNGTVFVDLNITSIEKKDNITANYNEPNRFIKYCDKIKIIEGEVNFYVNTSFPETIFFTSSPTLDNIKVKQITGKIEYDVEDFNIEPVKLNGIPELINQSGTELMLENPQLYISVNNPMGIYDVFFETGFQLTSHRKNKSKTIEIDPNKTNGKRTFQTEVGKIENNFVLVPDDTKTYQYEGYEHPHVVPFTELKNLLQGVDGIPTTIDVDAIDPNMPEQKVKDFLLNSKLGSVKGNYSFYVPLQLSNDSRIAYTDTIDGWNDEDVDAITIQKLAVRFDATTEVPFEIELTISAINTQGEPIAESSKAYVKAKADHQPIEVTIDSTITHLDGIIVKARLINKGNDTILGPDLKLYMENSKFVVTGYYEKEL